MSSDPRFSRLRTDPRFKRPRKDQHKIVVDQRFKSIFNNSAKKGKGKASVDKYGRRVSATKERDDLKKFYRLEGEDEDEDEAGPSDPSKRVPKRPDYARGEVLLESSDEDDEEELDDDSDTGSVTLGPQTFKPKKRHTTGSDDEFEINLDETEFADLDAQAEAAGARPDQVGFGEQKRTTTKGNETSRLAVVNLDWDHVRAAHLFRIFASAAALMDEGEADAKPKKRGGDVRAGAGKIKRVRVFPSEFGKSRIAQEDVEGPPKEIFADPKKKGASVSAAALLRTKGRIVDDPRDELDIEEINEKTIYVQEDADQYDQDELRKYQLQRLRYYYAIVECDSPQTAAFIYNELDATELEKTANLLDLSYVPDEMSFDDEFRDEATQDLGNLKPLDFATDALQSSKVKLTWDEDDHERSELTRRPLTQKEIEQNDFKAYLASTSDSEQSDDAGEVKTKGRSAERDRLRNLLLGGGGEGGDDFFDVDLPDGWGGSGKNRAGDMEVTFTPGLSANKGGDDEDEDETTLDRYKKKMRDKKSLRMTKWEEQKESWRKRQSGEEVTDVDGTHKRGDDEFFDLGEEEEKGSKRKSKKGRAPSPVEAEVRKPSTAEELALLAAGDEDDDGPKHFDMAKVIKAEKLSGKKKAHKYSKAAKEDAEPEDGRGFEIDVQDDRFKALHENHEFALDPSNPHFKKTKAMNRLLDERRKRLKEKTRGDEEQSTARKTTDSGDGDDLQKLVQSVKRKAGTAGRGDEKRLKKSS